MEDLLQLSFICILESIATRVVKKGALYTNPFTQKPVLLLGNRGLFFSDKTRINAAEARARKALERAAQLQNQLQPQGRLKRAVSDREDDGNASNGSLEDVSCHGAMGNLLTLLNGNSLLAILLQLLQFWFQLPKSRLRNSFCLLFRFPIWLLLFLLLCLQLFTWLQFLLPLGLLFLWDHCLWLLLWVGLWALFPTFLGLLNHPANADPKDLPRARSPRRLNVLDLVPPLLHLPSPLKFPLPDHLLTRYYFKYFLLCVFYSPLV